MATTDTGGHRRLPLAWPPCQVKPYEIRHVVSLLGLEGKVTLITGAAVGIGAATAAMFASEGATLALCDRDSAFAGGPGTFRRVLDVRHGDAVSAFVAEVVESFGRIDVMINNAGGTFAS